jgi:hypothetical protein
LTSPIQSAPNTPTAANSTGASNEKRPIVKKKD